MLRRFMFAGLGVFTLALAFHLGAAGAGSSAVECVEIAGFDLLPYGFLTFVSGGTATVMQREGDHFRGSCAAQLPRAGTVVACGTAGGPDIFVLYDDGEIYHWQNGWSLVQNVACEQVGVAPSTWGQIKMHAGG